MTGQPDKPTARTVEIPYPPRLSAIDVHRLRDGLGLGQALFAKLAGVSTKLVEACEAGTHTPSPMACRLLDAAGRCPISAKTGGVRPSRGNLRRWTCHA